MSKSRSKYLWVWRQQGPEGGFKKARIPHPGRGSYFHHNGLVCKIQSAQPEDRYGNPK